MVRNYKMSGKGIFEWSEGVLDYCDAVYGEDGAWRDVVPEIVDMPDGAADAVLREVQGALRDGQVQWTRKRHEHYPTRDIPVDTLPQTTDVADNLLRDTLGPIFEANYEGVAASDLSFQEAFVVRYGTERGGQRSLDAHTDGSPLSFVCALNDDYEGGEPI